MVYIDNVMVIPSTPDEHICYAGNILKLVEKGGITINLKKCNFVPEVIVYLEHITTLWSLYNATKRKGSVQSLKYAKKTAALQHLLEIRHVYGRILPIFARKAVLQN